MAHANARSRQSRVAIALACLTVVALFVTSYLSDAAGRFRFDPKSAGEGDRQVFKELCDRWYSTVEESISERPPDREGYFDEVRRLWLASQNRSPWLRMRLIRELRKSSRLEDAGFLLKVAHLETDQELRQRAREAAEHVAAQANSG